MSTSPFHLYYTVSDKLPSSPILHTLNYLHRKYPNPFATHVHSVDTLSRTVDPETGIIRSERIIGVQQGAPKWITKVSREVWVSYWAKSAWGADHMAEGVVVFTPTNRVCEGDCVYQPGVYDYRRRQERSNRYDDVCQLVPCTIHVSARDTRGMPELTTSDHV